MIKLQSDIDLTSTFQHQHQISKMCKLRISYKCGHIHNHDEICFHKKDRDCTNFLEIVDDIDACNNCLGSAHEINDREFINPGGGQLYVRRTSLMLPNWTLRRIPTQIQLPIIYFTIILLLIIAFYYTFSMATELGVWSEAAFVFLCSCTFIALMIKYYYRLGAFTSS